VSVTKKNTANQAQGYGVRRRVIVLSLRSGPGGGDPSRFFTF